jgi:hypothetical protein
MAAALVTIDVPQGMFIAALTAASRASRSCCTFDRVCSERWLAAHRSFTSGTAAATVISLSGGRSAGHCTRPSRQKRANPLIENWHSGARRDKALHDLLYHPKIDQIVVVGMLVAPRRRSAILLRSRITHDV